MASASPSTDQTQKETSTACHSSSKESHVTSPLNGSQGATNVYPINVPSSLEDPSLQPTALVFPSGIAFDYDNFPKIVSICWPVITDLSGNTVIARDGPSRASLHGAASSNDTDNTATTCINQVFRWDQPQNEIKDPVISTTGIKTPICASHNELQSEAISNNTSGCVANTCMRHQMPLQMPVLVRPCECPIHQPNMFKRPKLQHVEISAQILFNGNMNANLDGDNTATILRIQEHNQPSNTKSKHVSVCLPDGISGSLNHENQIEPVFGQVLVSPDIQHSNSSQAIIRKILPGKKPAKTMPLRVTFNPSDDPRQSTENMSTSAEQEKKMSVPCCSNALDEDLAEQRLVGENTNCASDNTDEATRSNQESCMNVECSLQIFRSEKATDDALIVNEDKSSETIVKNNVEPSEESYVFIPAPSQGVSQSASQPSTGSANQSIGSASQTTGNAHQPTGITQSNLKTGNKQENLRDLITRIHYIKSRLHRAECEQRKKQMLRTILGLRKRVKALAKGMRKENKDQRETSGETISGQELPEADHHAETVSQVKEIKLHAARIVKDESEIRDARGENAKSDVLLLSDIHQPLQVVSEEATQQNEHQNEQHYEQPTISSIDIVTSHNGAGNRETNNSSEQNSTAFCNLNEVNNNKTNNTNRQHRGSLSLLNSDGALNDFIVTLPEGIGLDSPPVTCGKRSFSSSDVDENEFQRNENIRSKKMRRLSLSENDAVNTTGQVTCGFQDVTRNARGVTQDGTSENLVPVEKNGTNGTAKHNEKNVIENEICILPIKDEINKKGMHSYRFQDVTQDSQGVTQDCISVTMAPTANEGDKTESSVNPNETNMARTVISELPIMDEMDSTVNASLGFKDVTHDAQRVTQDGTTGNFKRREENKEERNVKQDETNVSLNKISLLETEKELLCRNGDVTQRDSTDSDQKIRLAPNEGSKDTNSVRNDDTVVPRQNSKDLTEGLQATNIKEGEPSRPLLVDEMMGEDGEGEHSETCQDINQDCSDHVDESNSPDGSSYSKSNSSEDVEMDENQSGFTADNALCTQGMQNIDLTSASAVSSEDNENDQELFRFSLKTVLEKERETQSFTSPEWHNPPGGRQEDMDLAWINEARRFPLEDVLEEEGTQRVRFTSPTLHNPSGSQEDMDLMQSLQIRQARILNLTQKRDRLFSLAGLKMNRL